MAAVCNQVLHGGSPPDPENILKQSHELAPKFFKNSVLGWLISTANLAQYL
jgi:hypothetical protein